MPGKGQVIHMLGFGAIKFLYTLLSPVIIAGSVLITLVYKNRQRAKFGPWAGVF
jgi:hypothetical protein